MIKWVKGVIHDFKMSGLAGKAHSQYIKGNYKNCRNILNDILASDPPGHLVPIALAQLGEIDYHEGIYNQAIPKLEKSIALIKSFPKYNEQAKALNDHILRIERYIELSRRASNDS